MIKVLLFIGVAAILIHFIPHYWRMRQMEALRKNPPKRTCLAVRLPQGVDDSMEVFRRVFAQIPSLCTASSEDRRHGRGQISFDFVVTRPPGQATPELSYTLVRCDPEIADSLKNKIKTEFRGMANIIELEVDPLEKLAKEVQEPVQVPVAPDKAASSPVSS